MKNLLLYNDFINESKKYQHSVSPLYHGTGRKFDMFDFNYAGKDYHVLSFLGVHFSESDEVAEQFLKPPLFQLYEIELKYNKPLEMKEGDLVKDMYKFGFKKEYISSKWQFSLDLPYYIENVGGDINSKHIPNDQVKKTAFEYKRMLKRKGYDCIKYINEIELPNIKRYDWIAFYPDQINIINIWDQQPTLSIKEK